MAFSTHEFKLDLTPGASRPVLYASQGDIGRPFMARCYWNGATWTATGNTANIRGRKPDETVFDYTATVDGSTVTFETTEQMTIIGGPVECELVFSQGGDVIASANFVLIVEDSPYNPDALSESDVDTLGELVSDQIPPAVGDWLEDNVGSNPTKAVIDGAVSDWLDDNGVTMTRDTNGYVKLGGTANGN